jgi:NADPH:quinone reductase
MNTRQIVLKSRPKAFPVLDNFQFENFDLPLLKENEVLLKCLFFSVDPYLRGRMNNAKSYVSSFQLGQPIEGGVIAEVTESKSKNFQPGDKVLGTLPWRIQTIAPANALQKIDTTFAPASYYLGILGMPGLTAYFGLLDIGKPKSGEIVVVSGAAGAVGLIAGQLAKIKGCIVIGITGSDAKVNLLKEEFGFDVALNYKSTSHLKNDLARLCPNGIDIYFDNVGGEISDAVINNINYHGRIVLCGQIALYNSVEIPIGPRLQPKLLSRSVLMQGYIIGDYQNRFPEGLQQLSTWLDAGKLKFTETIIDGFDELPGALIGLFEGVNTGKMIVKL